MESSTDNTPAIRTEVRLFEDEKKIELVEDIDKKEELKKEAVYFAFPFAMSHPQFQYEIQNGSSIRPGTCIPERVMNGSRISTGLPCSRTELRLP